ncbi:MAG: FecR domain-containing protein [Deltaproteobacteria bacterium]|nr:FecR domain-containing protein [Deltaproteobacteria bacterium]MBN2671774.1 FecR domain-containing protein [Deltaproteobacteria bacterium]
MATTVRQGLGTCDDDATMERHAQLMVEALSARRKRKFKNGFVPAAAAAVLVIGLVGVWMAGSNNEQLIFHVNGTAKAGEAGDWISANAFDAAVIRFDQGSEIHLQRESAVRVVEHSKEAVNIELARGSLTADIHGNGKTQWKISVGPYQVVVLGTVFSVDWNEKQNEVSVQVTRGLVFVQGGHLSSHGIHVPKGNIVVVNGDRGTVSLGKLTRSKVDNVPVATSAGEDGMKKSDVSAVFTESSQLLASDDSHSGGSIELDKSNEKVVRDENWSWKKYYHEENFEVAMQMAKKRGIDKIRVSASLSELWALAEITRHLGDYAIQNQVLTSIRKRFPTSPKAKVAAYLIGQSMMAEAPLNLQAARWFETYLSESASGSMEQEAYNRLMILYDRTGKRVEARHAAERYIQKYPSGLYNSRARQLLEK